MYFHGTWTQCENTSKYVDTVNLFAKTWTKGHWPLDDLWPHICWGHRCDSTQGSLCPSPNPWVESHIRPQQMWGQSSSRGQWPLVQVFAKTITVSTYFHVCSGETRGSRTTCLKKLFLHQKYHHKNLQPRVFRIFPLSCGEGRVNIRCIRAPWELCSGRTCSLNCWRTGQYYRMLCFLVGL